MDYVELHSRSAFSFLRGASLPEQLVERAAQLQMPALGLCDRDGVYGAPRLFGRAKAAGVRPIVGAELTMEDKTILPVLVASWRGYQNLCQLLTRAHLRSEKGKARVLWNELPEFTEGLIALTGDQEGVLGDAVLFNRPSPRPLTLDTFKPHEIVDKLRRCFGANNVFIELQRHLLRADKRVRALIHLAEASRLPVLATNGVLYATDAERPLFDVFTCLRNHTTLDTAGLLLSPNTERHLKSGAQMRQLFTDYPEALTNTVRLAERLDFTMENLGYEFPAYPVPDGHTMDSFLRVQAFAGARNRYKQQRVPAKVRRQLETELALIAKLKVAGYFLIVWDIVQFCQEKKIMAQGRGSAANSTVCFCLGITAVDPLKFHTLFERFLTEGRKGSWPDIDIDLPSGERRESVIQEIYRRYGRSGAAMTANVITYRGRSAAREVGKVLGLSPDVLQRFSSLYANGDFPHTLELPLQMEKAGMPAGHARAEVFGRLYRSIQGLPRHLGQHSGGMIISQGKLDSVVPLENASMPNRVVAQWDKDDCEDLGIIKVDFLGLGMMSVLQDAAELTCRRGHPVDLADLPPDDPKSFAMMQEADTIGLFQIESRAQMATLPRMKPKCFYDLVIEVAIIRPGPIQGNLTNPYLARRAKRQPVTYYDKSVVPILERTLGVPLFQEQMLEIAMVMADFNGEEAEELRRALTFHRSYDRMNVVQKKLQSAMLRKGLSPKVIDDVAAAISSFALYGFPESHAISFAHLAYSSAYLKAHRAPEFYASLLNNQPMGFYSSASLVKDGQRHGVKFRSVCIQVSEWDCIIETDNAIRLGLRVVRNLSATGAKRLLAERDKRPFSSLEDFKVRANLNRDELRVLAELGALNCFAAHRRDALWHVERTLHQDDLFESPRSADLQLCERPAPPAWSSSRGRQSAHNFVSDDQCGLTSAATSPLQRMDYAERIHADYKGMHLTTGRHPMAILRAGLKDVWRAADLANSKNGTRLKIGGNVICRQRPGTAKGFVFVSVEDETGVANAIVTPDLFEECRLVITEEPYLVIEGILQNVDSVIHVKAERIHRLEAHSAPAALSHDFH